MFGPPSFSAGAVVCVALLAWLPHHASAARELRVAFGQEKAPYLWSDDEGHIHGIEYDILHSALGNVGDQLIAEALPNQRVIISLNNPKYDAVTGVVTGEAGEAFYSDEYLTYVNVAITRKSSDITLVKLPDILDHSVSIWQTAWERLDLGRFRPKGPNPSKYTEFTSQYQQTKFFWAGRCEVTVIDRNVFVWYTKTISKSTDTSDPVVFYDILPHLSVRAAFRSQVDRDNFNAGLKSLRANGDYDRIFAKYGLERPD